MKHWLAWALLIACLLAAGTIEAHAAPPPQPDSAVGSHHAVKPTRGYWRHIAIKGHKGLWWCYYASSRKPNAPLPCYRVKPPA